MWNCNVNAIEIHMKMKHGILYFRNWKYVTLIVCNLIVKDILIIFNFNYLGKKLKDNWQFKIISNNEIREVVD